MNVEDTLNKLFLSVKFTDRKCIVMCLRDYIEVEKYFRETYLLKSNTPSLSSDKCSIQYQGVNIFLDKEAIFSFVIDIELYQEIIKVKKNVYTIEPFQIVFEKNNSNYLIQSRLSYYLEIVSENIMRLYAL